MRFEKPGGERPTGRFAGWDNGKWSRTTLPSPNGISRWPTHWPGCVFPAAILYCHLGSACLSRRRERSLRYCATSPAPIRIVHGAKSNTTRLSYFPSTFQGSTVSGQPPAPLMADHYNKPLSKMALPANRAWQSCPRVAANPCASSCLRWLATIGMAV